MNDGPAVSQPHHQQGELQRVRIILGGGKDYEALLVKAASTSDDEERRITNNSF